MIQTESDLREALREATESLALNASLSVVRKRSRRRRALKVSAAGVALTAVVTLPLLWWPSQDPPPRIPVVAESKVPASPTGAPSPQVPLASPIRTGVLLEDGRELVMWQETDLIIGGRDSAGQLKRLDYTSTAIIDWVTPPTHFGEAPYFVNGPKGTFILIGLVKNGVARVEATRNGKTTQLELARLNSGTQLFWVADLPKSKRMTPGGTPQLKAFDASGTPLDSITY